LYNLLHMKNRQKNKDSFFARHFYKKRVNCPKCKNSIDAYLDKCPYCANERSIDVLPKRFSNMTFISDYKELLFFLVGTVGMILISFLVDTGIKSFPIQYDGLKTALSALISYIIISALFVCIISRDSSKLLKQLKTQTTNPRTWIFVLIGLAIIIAFNYGYYYSLQACGIKLEATANEKAIDEIVKKWPAIAFFFTVLLAPVIEELCYRVGLFSILRKRNRYLAYVVVVLLFAFVHFSGSLVTDPSQMAKEAINIPLYIVPSLILAITYEYAGYSASLYIHIINNLVSFAVVFALPL